MESILISCNAIISFKKTWLKTNINPVVVSLQKIMFNDNAICFTNKINDLGYHIFNQFLSVTKLIFFNIII